MGDFGKSWDHRKVIRVTNRTYLAGIAMLLLGIAIGAMADAEAVMYVVSGLGLLLAVLSYMVNIRRAVCPHCGAFLGTPPRMAGSDQKYCSQCGKEL